MNAGDRPDLPLDAEPLPFLRAAVIGRPVPGELQPEHGLALQEEPALRLHLAPPDTGVEAAPHAPARPRRPAAGPGILPATGVSLPVPLATVALAAAWILRRRTGPTR